MTKLLKLRCQVRFYFIADHSLDVVERPEMNSRDTKLDRAAVFNAQTNDRFVDIQDGLRRKKKMVRHNETTFIEVYAAFDSMKLVRNAS